MAVQLRKLGEADAMVYRDARLSALRHSPEAFPTSYSKEAALSLEEFAQYLAPKEDEPESFVLGAFAAGGALAGFVCFSRSLDPKLSHKGFLWGTYVSPDHRRQGVAETLVEQVIAAAQKMKDLQFIRLKVVSNNAIAQSLYESLGFKSYGVEVAAIKEGSKFLDQTLMRLDLN